MNSKSPHVRVYDPRTKKVSTIPAAELAPGMVEAHIQGIDGTCWLHASGLQQGPYQHPPFDETRRAKIQLIMSSLAEVHPLSAEQWEDGFRRDLHADDQIADWLYLAETYSDVIGGYPLGRMERRELLRVLVTCMTTDHEHVWQVLRTDQLPRDVVRAVVEAFYGEPTLKAAFDLVDPKEYVDEFGLAPVKVTDLNTVECRAVLKAADVVFGIDCHTRDRSIFYGLDRLKRIAAGGEEHLRVMTVLYDARTDQLEYLCAAVQVAKGSCCYGENRIGNES